MAPYNPLATYLQEADELLADIEQCALRLGAGGDQADTIHQLFRAFHTIKGSGAMCGLDAVAGFTHHVETALDRVRNGSAPVSPRLIEWILAARDHIQALLAAASGGPPAPPGVTERLAVQFEEFSGAPNAGAPAPTSGEAVQGEAAEQTWAIRFRPDPGLLACGGNPALLFRDLRKLGECEIEAHADRAPALEEIQPDRCYLWWSATLRTTAGADGIRDVFIFVEDGSELEIEPMTATAQPEPAPEVARPLRPAAEAAGNALRRESTVRVPSARLDRLVNLVGELVMNQSRIAQAASQAGVAELANPVQELERLVAELRDDVLGIRMLPIGTIFGRFSRLIHDLSKELGKDVDLVAEGAETELDKSILDQLAEPLVHLLRNALDHGIETAAERVHNGKSPRGTIRLTAQHTGSAVEIRVTDDGRGVDRQAVRAKAVERQLIPADASLTDKETLHLLALPGFSTALQVTSVSGRGVGLDVVKKQIDALRGSLAIASEPGQGCSVSLTLPLTLAIIEGLLVQLGPDQFIVPMAAVTENVELSREQRQRHNGRNALAVRGELVPYIDLRQAFGLGRDGPSVEKVVIARHEDQRVGLVVDRVLGTHQTVIQSLGRFFRNIDVVSGATILGDGNVALVLDVPAVIRRAGRLTAAA